jgi:hypothetical protein
MRTGRTIQTRRGAKKANVGSMRNAESVPVQLPWYPMSKDFTIEGVTGSMTTPFGSPIATFIDISGAHGFSEPPHLVRHFFRSGTAKTENEALADRLAHVRRG